MTQTASPILKISWLNQHLNKKIILNSTLSCKKLIWSDVCWCVGETHTNIDMKTTSTTHDNKEENSFNFNTSYKGKEMTLKIVADEDRYTVLHEDKTFGHIKIGERHTWYVVDSHFPAPSLVNTIGSKIRAQYPLAG
jgi:hypothetical protein